MVCVSNIEVHTKGGLRMSVFGITLLSIKRRMPQIIKAACTTLAAVFFVTAVLLFQENMYQWLMSSNKSSLSLPCFTNASSKLPSMYPVIFQS